jgi:hypothetical protein
MVSDFRYWLSLDNRSAVSIIFDQDHRGHMFDVDVPSAVKEYPECSIEMAVYKISLDRFRAESVC